MSGDDAQDGLLALLAAAAEDQPDEAPAHQQPRIVVHNPNPSGTSGRRHARPSKLLPGGPCACCGAKLSPQWRRPCPLGRDADPAALAASPAVLCNACGIYYQRHRALPDRKGMGNNYSRPSDDEGGDEPVTVAASGRRSARDEQPAYKGHGAANMMQPNSCDSSLLAAGMSLVGAGARGSPGGSGRSAEQGAGAHAAVHVLKLEHPAPQQLPGPAGAILRTSSPSPSEDSSFTPRSGRKRPAPAMLPLPSALRQASKLSHSGEHGGLMLGASAGHHTDTVGHAPTYGVLNLQHPGTTDTGHQGITLRPRPSLPRDELQPRDSRESSAAAASRPTWPAGSASPPRAGLPPRPPNVAHTVAAVAGQAAAQTLHLQLQSSNAAAAAPQPTVFRMPWGPNDRPGAVSSPALPPQAQPQQAPQAAYVMRAPAAAPMSAPQQQPQQQQWMFLPSAQAAPTVMGDQGITYSYMMPAQQPGVAPISGGMNGTVVAPPSGAGGPSPAMSMQAAPQQAPIMPPAPHGAQYVMLSAPQQAAQPQQVTYLTLPGGGTVQVLQAPGSSNQMGMMHAQQGSGLTVMQAGPALQYWPAQAPAPTTTPAPVSVSTSQTGQYNAGNQTGQYNAGNQTGQYSAGPVMTAVMGPPRAPSQPQPQPITVVWAPQGGAPQQMGHSRPLSVVPVQGGSMAGAGVPQHMLGQHLQPAYQGQGAGAVLMPYPAANGQHMA